VAGGGQQVWQEVAHEPTLGGLQVIASLDRATPHTTWNKPLLHVSISRRDRYPSWEEIGAVKSAFFGNTDACMILPRTEDYVSVHENCFHLWQIPVVWGIR
jgi:hypothetical protein